MVDADIIARQVVAIGAPALQKIAEHFGPDILQNDGALNRAALREVIFNQPQEKQWLDGLLHPLIHLETQRLLAAIVAPMPCGSSRYWLKMGYLNEHTAYWSLTSIQTCSFNALWLATAFLANRPRTFWQHRQRAQRLACADDIIENSGSPETIAPRVASLHRHYLSLAAATQQDPHHE